MVISLLHPSRGRPEKSKRCTDMWLSRACADVELIVSVDEDDPRLPDYRQIYPRENGVLIVHSNRSAVDAVNSAALMARGDIMIVLSDDFECPQRWGEIVLGAVKGASDFVLKVNDGVQRYIVTMPIFDRKYYDRFGYVYHPDYLHMFSDTHFTHVADCLKRIIWRNDIHFSHRHYSVTKGQKPDEVNRRADATWEQGKQLYLQHVRQKFGLGVNVWDIDRNGAEHIKWLKHNLRHV